PPAGLLAVYWRSTAGPLLVHRRPTAGSTGGPPRAVDWAGPAPYAGQNLTTTHRTNSRLTKSHLTKTQLTKTHQARTLGARPAPRRASQHLAWIENALGIEGGLDGSHQLEFDGAFDARQRLALHDADAMLGRKRAAEGQHRLVDRLLQGSPKPKESR